MPGSIASTVKSDWPNETNALRVFTQNPELSTHLTHLVQEQSTQINHTTTSTALKEETNKTWTKTFQVWMEDSVTWQQSHVLNHQSCK